MLIDSPEKLRDFTSSLLDEAKRKIVEDDELSAVVLMFGEGKQVEVDAALPEMFLNGLVRQFIKQDGDFEVVAHISLGYAIKSDTVRVNARPSTDPNRYLVIAVQVSHRDFGCLSTSMQVKREAPKQFEFGEPDWSQVVTHSAVLDHLWAKPRLN